MVTGILEEINEHFGELVIHRGHKHDFLGIHVVMNRENKTEEIEMTAQLQEEIDILGEEIDKQCYHLH